MAPHRASAGGADPRHRPTSFTLADLTRQVGGAVLGDAHTVIAGLAAIEDAEPGDLVFAENERFLKLATSSRASAVLSWEGADTSPKPSIQVADPRYAFTRILDLFAPPVNAPSGVHPTAVLGRNVELGPGVSIGPLVSVGDGVTIGDGAIVRAGCMLGEGCIVGERCLLHASVTLYPGVTIGDRTIIHSGAVIGADGYGYVQVSGAARKVPHLGTVAIGEDVEIGANCTIDRAKTGATTIGARTKIDNLVHIAHNCRIGDDCLIIAQVGVAGSVQVGNGVVLAGQAGVRDHVAIGDRAAVLAQAAVWKSVPAGAHISGNPARDHRERLRQEAAVGELPGYLARVRKLERANGELQRRAADLEAALRMLLDGPAEAGGK